MQAKIIAKTGLQNKHNNLFGHIIFGVRKSANFPLLSDNPTLILHLNVQQQTNTRLGPRVKKEVARDAHFQVPNKGTLGARY